MSEGLELPNSPSAFGLFLGDNFLAFKLGGEVSGPWIVLHNEAVHLAAHCPDRLAQSLEPAVGLVWSGFVAEPGDWKSGFDCDGHGWLVVEKLLTNPRSTMVLFLKKRSEIRSSKRSAHNPGITFVVISVNFFSRFESNWQSLSAAFRLGSCSAPTSSTTSIPALKQSSSTPYSPLLNPSQTDGHSRNVTDGTTSSQQPFSIAGNAIRFAHLETLIAQCVLPVPEVPASTINDGLGSLQNHLEQNASMLVAIAWISGHVTFRLSHLRCHAVSSVNPGHKFSLHSGSLFDSELVSLFCTGREAKVARVWFSILGRLVISCTVEFSLPVIEQCLNIFSTPIHICSGIPFFHFRYVLFWN